METMLLNDTGGGCQDGGTVRPDAVYIREQRKLHGLSQERLSELAGISLKTLRNIETNSDYGCRPSTIASLAAYFNVEPRRLVKHPTIPSTNVKLLTSATEIIQTNIDIVQSAKKLLVCAGARSRDESYLQAIEDKLRDAPSLIHYRVLSWPPFRGVFQQHLLRLLEMRDVHDWSLGYKTLHIGIFDDLTKEPEFNL